MAEYITKEALRAFPIRENHCDKEHANEHFIRGIESVMEYAEGLPAADVAPVVRCKDCKHCDVYNTVDVFAVCRKTGETFIPFGTDIREHFCAYGERKETNNDD